MKPLFKSVIALFLTANAWPALAHTGLELTTIEGFSGFLSGLLHPLQGIDHLLVMLAVGIWAARLGGRAVWLLPASFLSMMLLGAGFQQLGLDMAAAEYLVALSVLGFGLSLCRYRALPLWLASVLTGIFAVSHGYVHAAEAEQSISAYAGGFLLSTAGLHGVGLLIGQQRGRLASMLRGGFVGVCTLTGVALLAGVSGAF